MKPVRTHIRAYQTVSEKQTGIPAGLLLVRAIYAWNERLQPPDCVPANRYRTYSTEVTSLSRAISRFNACVCACAHTLN